MDSISDPDEIEKIERQSGLPANAKGWVGVVGGLIGLVIGLSLFYFILGHKADISSRLASTRRGEHSTSFPIDVRGLAMPTKVNYVYRVVGPVGTTAKIAYVNQDGTMGEVKQASLPWSVSTTTSLGNGLPAGSGQPAYVDIQLNTHGKSSTVTCQAFADGTLDDQETSTGVDLILTCGFAP